MINSKIRTLLLYAQYSDKLSYFDDWKDAFLEATHGFETVAVNVCLRSNLKIVKRDIASFDLIVLLHSALGDSLEYINLYREVLKSRKGKILTFVGNEVNIPGALIKDKISLIRDLKIDFIGTQLPLEAGEWLYAECHGSKVVPLPHALNPKAFRCTIEQQDRKLDIGVRTYKYSPYLGDNDRNDLIDFLIANQADYQLNLDINYTQRFNRADWASFLNQCKATVSTEAGSLFLERDDRTMLEILSYCQQKVGNSSARIRVVSQDSVYYKLRNIAPDGLKRFFKKTFGLVNETEVSYLVSHEEIYDKFFKNYPPHAVYSKAISSRHFDAIGTKTCQLMFPGRFNDILLEDRHYIAIRRDFSNFDDCIRKIRDLDFKKSLTNRAYEHVMSNHTYQHRVAAVEKLMQ